MDFIGIDVGTSGCKASVVSETGETKRSTSRSYAMYRTQPKESWLDMREVWNCVLDMLKELASAAGEVKAMAVSALGDTLVFLDRNGDLLWPEGITYLDSRNAQEWAYLKKRVESGQLYDFTGKIQPQIASVNQYHYWKRTRPKDFEKLDRILFPDSFIAFMLSANAAYDYSTASNSLFYDINRYRWSECLTKAYEIDLNYFPRVIGAGEPVGRIRKSICQETGLPSDIIILAGCHDQIATTVGAGAIEPGDANLGLGSTESLNLLIDATQTGQLKQNRLPIEPYIQKGMYFSLISNLLHGNCINWFVRTFGRGLAKEEQAGSAVYDLLNENCPEHQGEIVFLPYLSGTCFPEIPNAMGSFIGMDTGTDVYALYRAMLEGLSCESAQLLEKAERCGAPVRNITATGGAARSAAYLQIKADVMGREIRVLDTPQAGINGLAMLCATHLGCYGSLKEAGEKFVRISRTYTPKTDGTRILERHKKLGRVIREAYSG